MYTYTIGTKFNQLYFPDHSITLLACKQNKQSIKLKDIIIKM